MPAPRPQHGGMTTAMPVGVAYQLVQLDLATVGSIEGLAEEIAVASTRFAAIVVDLDQTPAWEGNDSKKFILKCHEEIDALRSIYAELRACADQLRHEAGQRQERIMAVMRDPYAQHNDVNT